MKHSLKHFKKLVTIILACLLMTFTLCVMSTAANEESGVLKQYDFMTIDDFHQFKKDIIRVEFKNSIPEIDKKTTKSWDVSAKDDNSVIAWLDEYNKSYVLSIAAEGGVKANKNSSNLFNGFVSLTSIDGLQYFDTSAVTDMNYMFYDCPNLLTLDVSAFDTSNVTNMKNMFKNCESLSVLDVSSFNTSKVTNMSGMFFGCASVKELNLSNFDTSNVTDMSYMFCGCSLIESLDLSSFNVQKVKNMCGMLSADRDTQTFPHMSLKSVNFTGWNTESLKDISDFVYGCTALTSLDLSLFNTKNIEKMNLAFANCTALENLNISNWDLKSLSEYNESFKNSTKIKVTATNVTLYENSYKLFNASHVSEINISDSTIRSSTLDNMFKDCTNLKKITFSNNTTPATTTRSMFENCANLAEIDLTDFNTSNIIDMSRMFKDCSKLGTIDISSFELDYYDENTGRYKTITLDSMFENCTLLTKIYVREWWEVDTQRTYGYNMFYNCPKLQGEQSKVYYESNKTDETYANVDAYLSKGNGFQDKPVESPDDNSSSSTPSYGMSFFDRILEWIRNFFAKLFGF